MFPIFSGISMSFTAAPGVELELHCCFIYSLSGGVNCCLNLSLPFCEPQLCFVYISFLQIPLCFSKVFVFQMINFKSFLKIFKKKNVCEWRRGHREDKQRSPLLVHFLNINYGWDRVRLRASRTVGIQSLDSSLPPVDL